MRSLAIPRRLLLLATALALASCAAPLTPLPAQASPVPDPPVAVRPAAPTVRFDDRAVRPFGSAHGLSAARVAAVLSPAQRVALFGDPAAQRAWIDSTARARTAEDAAFCAMASRTARREGYCRDRRLAVRARDLRATRHDVLALRDSLLATPPDGVSYMDSASRGHRLASVRTVSRPSLAPAVPTAASLSAARYAALGTVVLTFNATCPAGQRWCERDRGGYVDQWRSPDKYGHALGAAAVTSLAVQAGVRPLSAFLVTNVLGAGLELTQAIGGGYVSGRDVVWNAGGAALPLVLHWALARVR